MRDRQYKTGFSLLEIIIAVAIIVTTLLGMMAASHVSFQIISENNNHLRAIYLAEEGLEAARTVRDQGWSANIASLSMSTDLYPVFSGGIWTLSTTSPGVIDGIFTRTVRVDCAVRDMGTSDIVVGSTGCANPGADSGTRQVVATVSWQGRRGLQTISITTFITDLFED